MNPQAIVAIAIAAMVVMTCLRDVLASQPPPEQVEEASEAAKLIPADLKCIWLNERTCVSEAEWERLMKDFDGE